MQSSNTAQQQKKKKKKKKKKIEYKLAWLPDNRFAKMVTKQAGRIVRMHK